MCAVTAEVVDFLQGLLLSSPPSYNDQVNPLLNLQAL